MKDLRCFFDRWKHLLVLLYFPIYLAWFNYVETHVTTQFHEVHMLLDDYIPFCEYFVIPYILWFAYVAWGMTYTALNNKHDFYKLCGFLYTGMTLFLIISTVFPNGHYLRPTYFSHHNFYTTLCEFIYQTDTATNLFPSIHVYNSLGVHFAVMNCKDFKHKKTLRLMSLVLCISIILATMFIKQHSTFDVLTALLLGFVMYQVVYVKDWSRSPEKVSGKSRILHT